jgi:hypothetical protein
MAVSALLMPHVSTVSVPPSAYTLESITMRTMPLLPAAMLKPLHGMADTVLLWKKPAAGTLDIGVPPLTMKGKLQEGKVRVAVGEDVVVCVATGVVDGDAPGESVADGDEEIDGDTVLVGVGCTSTTEKVCTDSALSVCRPTSTPS